MLVQQALLDWGCDVLGENLLPRFGADGSFGQETDRAVRRFQQGRTIDDGIVGPLTLDEIDSVVIPSETRRGDEGGGEEENKAPAAGPPSDDIKAQVSSTSLTVPRPSVVRTPPAGPSQRVAVTLDRPLEFTATAKLKPGHGLDGARFGIFQLGRRFETWRAVYGDVDAPAKDRSQSFNRDETNALRQKLPARDHTTVFYAGQSNTATGTSKQVSVDYHDHPTNVFETPLVVQGRVAALRGVFAETFFFTAFGMVTKEGKPFLLRTFFWSMRYCEDIGPGKLATPNKGGRINMAGTFDCLKGSCRANEKGADSFGSSGGPSFGEIARATLPKFGGGERDVLPVGPGTFKVPCAK
jgi:peptidoglycan hydrolase-like protein with peptidoglycan-binding domain